LGHLNDKEKATKLANEYGKSCKKYATDCSVNKLLKFRKTEIKVLRRKKFLGLPILFQT
jgi:hypothetical protein